MALPPSTPFCPPHHWQVVEDHGQQQWTCYRCHAVREQASRDVEYTLYTPQRKSGQAWRKEPPPKVE